MTNLVQETKVNTPTLSIRNAHIGYTVAGEFTTAVKDVSFDVHAGETVMLLGPSGCGKSTLLKAVAGFNKLSDGELRVVDKPEPPPGPDRAVVFQEFDQLFAWRTVRENVAYPLRVNGRSKAASRDIANQYLTMTGLSDAALGKFPHQLSGGMKQRVAIARALALEPQMLLMDEPFASLDAQTRAKLQRDLKGITASTDTTTLFVTHSLEEALALGHRIVILTQAPSVVAEIIDPKQAHDDAAQAALRERIRQLLAGNRADAFIDGTIE